jgi:hypothetical protein
MPRTLGKTKIETENLVRDRKRQFTESDLKVAQ